MFMFIVFIVFSQIEFYTFIRFTTTGDPVQRILGTTVCVTYCVDVCINKSL